jgi:hypothetical protein
MAINDPRNLDNIQLNYNSTDLLVSGWKLQLRSHRYDWINDRRVYIARFITSSRCIYRHHDDYVRLVSFLNKLPIHIGSVSYTIMYAIEN